MVRVLPGYSGSTEGARRVAANDGGVVGGRASAGISWRGSGDRAVFSAAPTSSPFSAMTAIGVLTATCSVPSGITILASTPSSIASTSIVALSVSNSARTSPVRTASPSLLSQRAILPSVIVGDNAGIKTSVAMAYDLSQIESRSIPPSFVVPAKAGTQSSRDTTVAPSGCLPGLPLAENRGRVRLGQALDPPYSRRIRGGGDTEHIVVMSAIC